METDSLNMITNIAKENEGATITIPTNIPVVPPLFSVIIQQGWIHTQTQVQEYERKSTMSRKVINEATLRIQIPRNSVADSTLRINSTTFRINSTASFGHFTLLLYFHRMRSAWSISCRLAFHTYDVYTSLLGYPKFKFVYLPDKSTFPKPSTPAEGFEEYPRDLNLQEREIYWTSTPVIIHLDDIVCISFTSYLINTNLLFIYLNMCFLCHLHLLQFSELITFVTIFVVDNICSCISQKLNVCSWIYSC